MIVPPPTRRFIVNPHNRQESKAHKLSCVTVVFIGIVGLLMLAVVYYAATFAPIIEPNVSQARIQAKDAVNLALLNNRLHPVIQAASNAFNTADNEQDTERETEPQTASSQMLGPYDVEKAISIRKEHESPIHLNAKPLLVGLGAEKSGSTSMGAALFNSGEYSCPDRDEINVETKYWSDCLGWDSFDDLDGTIKQIRDKSGGRCSVQQYQSTMRWKGGANQFEKSVDYLGLPYVARVLSDLLTKEEGTKIFLMARYPPPRISSTWKFFVGAEKDNMPSEYGNVEKFTLHLLENKVMMELIDLLDPQQDARSVMELDWTGTILPKWNEWMLSIQTQCKEEAPIAGFKPAFCNPSQLLRRAVGLSCYIVPIMQYITYLGIDEAINSFRIIQSELFFEDGKDIMDRVTCWSKQGTVDTEKCDMSSFYQSGTVSIKKLQGTVKSKTSDFSDELIDRLHSVFEPCHARLFELLQLYPQLAIKEFVWDYWHFKPSSN